MAVSSSTSSTALNSPAVPSLSETSPLLAKSKTKVLLDPGSSNGNEDDELDEEDGVKGREVEVYVPGDSTFSQTLLNTLGDIIGTGLLACPIAIAHAGWLFGPLFLVITGAVTLWTLKIILRIIEKDRRLRSFTDVIAFGLGPKVEPFFTVFFVLEVSIWIIALVVLFSDSLEAVWPIFTSDQWKVWGLIVIIPTAFVPLRLLSYSSALGITSTWTLVGILVFSGIATPHSPGALRDPAPTDLLPAHGIVKLATVIGLLASGFGGHGLIPNLIRDMKHPKQADRVVESAYAIAMIVYFIVAICGYLMYGRDVSDEVSKDLAKTPGFSPILNKLAVWMVAINPLTKISLGLRPLSDIIYTYFNLHPTVLIPRDARTPRYTETPCSPTSTSSAISLANSATPAEQHPIPIPRTDLSSALTSHNRREAVKAILRPVIRVILAVLSVVGALVMPSFESVMGLLGSGFAILSLVIIPVWAGARIFGWKWYEKVTVVVSAVVAVFGTVAAFWPER